MEEHWYEKNIKRKISECKKYQQDHLDLSHWQLKYIPNEVFQLKHLKSLNVSGNKIKRLTGVEALENLSILDVSHNELDHLPYNLKLLNNLQYLDVSLNPIRLVHTDIDFPPLLQHLDISMAELLSFPEQILELKNLETLKMSGNAFRHIPKQITGLTNLQELTLDENDFVDPPPEIAGRGIRAIFNYFNEKEMDDSDHLYEAKLLIVGEERAGKTSLMKSLANPDFSLNPNEKSTEGINVETLAISKEQTQMEKDFLLNIWDFGGQEIYHSTHQFFLTKRSLYLLITEPRKEIRHDDFFYWLNIIKLLGDTSPVLLVQHKCDQPLEDITVNEYKKRFNNIVQHENLIRTSCVADKQYTIEKLKETIISVVKNADLFPHIGTSLPKTWVNVREEIYKLQADGNPYISYTDYEKTCERYGMSSERAAYLADFLHDLGAFLHFRSNPLLERTVFLNNQWVTEGVYKVLDDERVISRHGEFGQEDLKRLWVENGYKNMEAELLQLMQEFKICFPLSKNSFLAPQRLPKDEPPYEWRSDEKNLFFEYHYGFMPKGLLTRFIVEQHKDIYQKTYWRYGVLLDINNTRVLVREDYFNRKIVIKVEGVARRDILGEIRGAFRKIHNEFNNIEVEEMVPCICDECQGSATPSFFKYSRLINRLEKGHSRIPCDKSEQDIPILRLIEAALPFAEFDTVSRRQIFVQGDYIDGNKNSANLYDSQGVIVGNSASIQNNQMTQTDSKELPPALREPSKDDS